MGFVRTNCRIIGSMKGSYHDPCRFIWIHQDCYQGYTEGLDPLDGAITIGSVSAYRSMNHPPLFDIKNLRRLFNNEPVLNIPDLKIPRGKLVVIVGNSGCGKTTLLETLGLMGQPRNDETGRQDISIRFFPEDDEIGEVLEYQELWKNRAEQARVRREYFSFLFQHPDFIPFLSVRENVALARIVQEAGSVPTSVFEDADLKIEHVGLPAKRLESPKVLSGGEEQRVAFARSDIRKYRVLFADEPTGNLDEHNARIIFRLLRLGIENKNDVSSIVVTHNLPLAIHYADVIIPLTHKGFTSSDSIFSRSKQGWCGTGLSMPTEDPLAIKHIISDSMHVSEIEKDASKILDSDEQR